MNKVFSFVPRISQTYLKEYIDSVDISFHCRVSLLDELHRFNRIFFVYYIFKFYLIRYLEQHRFDKSTLKILELGGGLGSFSSLLIPFLETKGYNVEYHILDIHTDVLELGKERLQKKGIPIHTHNGGDQHLKIFDDQTFDLVISLHTLHHIQPLPLLVNALKDIMRVSRCGFFMVDFRRSYCSLLLMKSLRFFTSISSLLYKDGITSIYRSYTSDEMYLALREASSPKFTFKVFVKKLFAPYQLIYGHRRSTNISENPSVVVSTVKIHNI